MTAGLGVLLRIQWRVRRRAIVTWVVALTASMIGTAVSIASLYDTPEKIQTYASAVTSTALLAINGRVEGLNSLGGVIQDEFGFLAAFIMPLLGISLMTSLTRGEEQAGRHEALLSGRISRHMPVLAASLVTSAAIGLTGIGFTIGLVAEGVPFVGAMLYSLSLMTLAFSFAGLAAVLAQLTLHARNVYALSLLILAVSYVVRGVGDVTGSWLTWLSPLGWAEKTAPFGPQRWWVLAIPLAAGIASTTLAVTLAARRDLGSALVQGGVGPDHASTRVRTGLGLAVWIHRPAIVGWTAGALILAAMMGSLAQQLLDAMASNPALADAIGASGGRPEDGFMAMTLLYLAVIASGYVVQAIGTLRGEESSGRLEAFIGTGMARRTWLFNHVVVIVGGLVMLTIAGSLTLAGTAALSTGSSSAFGSVVAGGIAYLPADLVLAGVALALYGYRPEAFSVAWAAYAITAFVALLGPGLQLAGWMEDLAPTTHIGDPPVGSPQLVPLLILGFTVMILLWAAFAGFSRRTVPRT